MQATASATAREPVDYVNPNIGTIGHLLTATSPIAAMPYGMVQVAPVTTPGITDRYLADKIYGFPAAGMTVMPTIGPPEDAAIRCFSGFDHDLEVVTPYYYSVFLEDLGVTAEYTVADHAVYYRFHFPENAGSNLLLIVTEPGELKVVSDFAVAGYGTFRGVRSYVYAEFSKPMGTELAYHPSSGKGATGIVAQFDTDGRELHMRVGISFISADQARRNLIKEMPTWDFDGVKARGRRVWNEALGKIRVSGGSQEERIVFYTALYRAMLRMINITENGRYFSGYDNQVHTANGHDFYVDDSLWDTYRCLHPLQLLTDPERSIDMVHSYLRMYEQSGWIPRAPDLGGDRAFMIGNHAAAFIADVYVKGYRSFDVREAYTALKKNAMEGTMLPWRSGPLTELDRFYHENGFFPALKKGETEWVKEVHPFERRQAVSVTLEHSYDDWCLAQLAKALGYDEDYEYFRGRSLNYRKLFDARIGLMAPRSADGNWVEGYDPKLGGGQGGRDYFAECNAWIYTFHVQHDIGGLIKLFGGRDRFADKLDALFVEQCGVPKYTFLAQFPDATGLMGQYAHGNEPSFHIPYLYNYAGQPWKTQRKVREIMRLWYSAGPLGICGDEDGGAMSSWYVFSAMGFYPVCPGSPVYDIGSPLFDEIHLNLTNGKLFTIKALRSSEKDKYIQSAELNGKPLEKPWFYHSDLQQGATLVLHMGPRPNKDWGSSPAFAPPSAV